MNCKELREEIKRLDAEMVKKGKQKRSMFGYFRGFKGHDKSSLLTALKYYKEQI